MISQSAWLRRHITPVAKAEGLTKKGNVLRLTGEHGDCAVLEFHPHLIDRSMEVFFVRVSIVPGPQRAWVHRDGWEIAQHWLPTASAPMVQWELIPPAEVAYEPGADMPSRGYWAYGPRIDPNDCARAMVRMLREETIPEMRRLLDREQLFAEVRAPSPWIRRRRPPGWAEVLLKVDRLSPAELEPLLQRVELDYPVADEFIAWARGYAANRSAGM
ncbi:hypothetical protein J7E96_02815 [Streptomyces sp. ISL-96]|uniref:hypothetical protein n=1 Tax=Streptomyces sp. ISL-96 TaxID=2819191 RepID=UPI001BE902C2|nr:hypothetical protein [Streptomyces sp. ISL-96]MBT2487487.1 hypothetical protein [Streptomyces sp. ISL-96]